MELSAVLGLSALLLMGQGGPAPAATAEDWARRIEERHRRTTDLTARFVQVYRSGVLGREIVERGIVQVKPPGRMRWEYRDPEKKLFVSDGKTCYFYVPADRQVIRRDQAGERGVAILLLSGRADILTQFDVGLEQGSTGPRLRLVPRKPDPDVERVYLEPDATARIESIEIVDLQGNRSRFRFESFRENAGLPDRLFRFSLPPGVEVIDG